MIAFSVRNLSLLITQMMRIRKVLMMYCLSLSADKVGEPLILLVVLFQVVAAPPPRPFTPPPLPMLSLSQPAPVRLVSHPQLPFHMIRLLTHVI